VASIDFRSVYDAAFPSNVHDIKSAIKWLRQQSTEYHLDKDKFIIAGLSSGGHLAALTGVSAGVKDLDSDLTYEETKVVGIIACAGAFYLKDWAQEVSALSTIMGVTETDVDVEALAALCTPSSHLTSDDPPILLIHGTQDNVVPYEFSVDFQKEYERLGLTAELVTIPGGGHGHRFVTDKERKPILDFLSKI